MTLHRCFAVSCGRRRAATLTLAARHSSCPAPLAMHQAVCRPPPGVAGWSKPPAAGQALGPPGARAIVSWAGGGRRVAISHGDLSKLASSAAATLRRSGLRAGGLVGLALGDASTYAAAYQLGVWQVGAACVHVPVGEQLQRAQLLSALEDAHVVVASPSIAHRVRAVLSSGITIVIPEELAASTAFDTSTEGAGECTDSDSDSGSDSDSDSDSATSRNESSSESESSSSCDDTLAAGAGKPPSPEGQTARGSSLSSSDAASKHDAPSSGKFAHEQPEQSERKRPAEKNAATATTRVNNKRQRPAQPQTIEDSAVAITSASLQPLPASASEAEAVVSRVRNSRLVGTDKRTDVPADVQAAIVAAKRTMQAALSRLSSDLYSQQCRWVLELLQNADDNDYATSSKILGSESALGSTAPAQLPRVDISITRSHLCLVNNERGFTASDVEALCDIGASTKTSQNKRKRCIGEKGIGFKSVFAISDTPYVRSNYFSFRFEKDAAEGIGSLVPRWVKPQNFPCIDDAGCTTLETPHPGTCIILPLHSSTDRNLLRYSAVRQTMRSLDALVLLFLRQLRVLTVSMASSADEDSSVTRPLENSCKPYRRAIRKEGQPPNIILRDEHSTDATMKSVTTFRIVQHMALIPVKVLNAIPQRKQGSAATEIACAFPLAEDGSADASILHKVFVFLPTRAYGLRFPLHAEFSLPSSREEVLRDSVWNQWLAQEAVADAFIAAVQQTFIQADEPLRRTWYRFIPRRSDLIDNFFLQAHTRVCTRLKTIECIATEGRSGLRRPRQVVLRTDSQLEQILSSRVLLAALNLEYAMQGTDDGCDGDTLVALGCSKLSNKMLLKCMKHPSFVAEMRSQDDTWLRALYAVLARYTSSSKWLIVMQQLPLVRLIDGSLCCALRETGPVHDGSADTRLVFMPSSELDRWMLSSSLNVVRPTTICSDGNLTTVPMISTGDEQDDPVVHLLLKLGVCPATPVAVIRRYILPHHKRSRAPNSKIGYEEALILCIQVSYVKMHLQMLLQQADDSQAMMQELRDTMLLRSVNPRSSQPKAGTVLACNFMVASNLYLPSAYTGPNQPGLEHVFCDDPDIRTVDPCYLGTDPPDPPELLAVNSSGTEERREAWSCFLQQLGCRVVPELTKKEMLLSPAAADKRFSVHARGNVAVCDHILSPEFRRVLASGQQNSLGALLALMDRKWIESYAHRQHCVLNYQQQPGGMKRVDRVQASFIRELRELLRVPTSHGLMPLSQVFCRTPELLRIFGEGSVPFVTPNLELSSLEMKQALGISGELTTELALAVLRCERSRWSAMSSYPKSAEDSMPRVRAACEILRMRFDQESIQIRQTFATEPLIAVPSANSDVPMRFLLVSQVCWDDDESTFGTQHGFLQRHYPGLETFFCTQLGVSKHLLMRDIADRLVELSLAHSAGVSAAQGGPTLDAVQSLVLQLYQRLNQWLEFANAVAHFQEQTDRAWWPPPEPMDWQCLEHLRCQPIFLSRNGNFCHAQAVIAPDDAELQALFIASTEGVNLLAMTAVQAVQLSCLLRFFGLTQLSSAVTTAPEFALDEQSVPRHEQWTRKVLACLLPLAQYIHHRHPERILEFQTGGVLRRLAQTLSVRTIKQTGMLRVRYSLLREGDSGTTTSCLSARAALAVRTSDQDVALVIDVVTVRNNLDQLASELLRLLTDSHAPCPDLELTNFTELLLSKSSTDAVDRMLLHRKIPMLSTEVTVSLGVCRVPFSDPVPAPSADVEAGSAEVVSTTQTRGTDDSDACDDSSDSESDEHEDEVALVARPVAATHREHSVARQAHQGKAAELRCAKEEATRLWPWICNGQSEPWRTLSAEFQRINQLGARGGSIDLIDVRRPGSEAALVTRLHVAAVAEGIGYDVLSIENAVGQPPGSLGRLVRIEVKSCAVRRSLAGKDAETASDGTDHRRSTATQGLTFYMSEAERKMAALYLKSHAFKSDRWKLQMYAPPAGEITSADGCGATVDSMVPIDLTDVVSNEIVHATPTVTERGKGERARTGVLRATEWCFAL